jgi:hypothetical protein
MKNRSRPAAFVRLFSATFWPAATLAGCFIGGPNRHIQPERYAKLRLKLIKKYKKYIANKGVCILLWTS